MMADVLRFVERLPYRITRGCIILRRARKLTVDQSAFAAVVMYFHPSFQRYTLAGVLAMIAYLVVSPSVAIAHSFTTASEHQLDTRAGLGTATGPRRMPTRSAAPASDDEVYEVGGRLHQMIALERAREAAAKAAAQLLEVKSSATVHTKAEAKAQILAKTAALSETKTGAGEDPWWLKDLPWWMPPPPEWGPLPPTMYEAYWERPIGAPLSSPNYGSLYTRVEDMEGPVGHSRAVETAPFNRDNPQAGLQPPVAVRNEEQLPGAIAAAQGSSFIELQTEARMGSTAKVVEPPPPPMEQQNLGGPVFIADHMPEFATRSVPQRFRSDRRQYYKAYWDRLETNNRGAPYRFAYAPVYPPTFSSKLASVVPRATRDSRPSDAMYPSKYDEPTKYQEALRQQIGAEQDKLMDDPAALRDPNPPDV